jgi:hypothetical protein
MFTHVIQGLEKLQLAKPALSFLAASNTSGQVFGGALTALRLIHITVDDELRISSASLTMTSLLVPPPLNLHLRPYRSAGKQSRADHKHCKPEQPCHSIFLLISEKRLGWAPPL